MNFKETLERLNFSDVFKNFKKENEKAFLCSAFFIVDFETKADTNQIDFFLPDRDKMAVFVIDNEVTYKLDEIFKEKKDEIRELSPYIKIDTDDFEGILKKEGKQKIKKIFAVLHHHEKRQIWNLTCLLESFNILNIHLDCQTGEILKEEKASLFDFAQFVKGNRKENEKKEEKKIKLCQKSEDF